MSSSFRSAIMINIFMPLQRILLFLWFAIVLVGLGAVAIAYINSPHTLGDFINKWVKSYIPTFVIISVSYIITNHVTGRFNEEQEALRALHRKSLREAEAINEEIQQRIQLRLEEEEREAEKRRREEEERAYWNSPEGRKVRAAHEIAEIEKQKAEALAKLRIAEAHGLAGIAADVADKEEARQDRQLDKLSKI
ncbi:hypothetical protein [Magnetospirillum sp. LM-5]|uniref:hypothetical protein n=1 Tax=Magnetospirillum sp. LM-5 TaxID=2681466 RepID=UPI00156F8B96|nr:hypothetical protein [Magnetospirillum sp. LM-5]